MEVRIIKKKTHEIFMVCSMVCNADSLAGSSSASNDTIAKGGAHFGFEMFNDTDDINSDYDEYIEDFNENIGDNSEANMHTENNVSEEGTDNEAEVVLMIEEENEQDNEVDARFATTDFH